MPRFVVLTHDHPVLHGDFMLEQPQTLRTWRLIKPPEPGCLMDAELLADHRLAYLDNEGPVSGGRGEVRRWDRGEYEIIESTAERLVVRLIGERPPRALSDRDFLDDGARGQRLLAIGFEIELDRLEDVLACLVE